MTDPNQYHLVSSKSEERTYYLFTPDGREVSLYTKKGRLFSEKATYVELTVARTLFKNNQIIH